jgi:hypothetical protein
MSKNEKWMESSLTSPADRKSTREKPWRPASNDPPLSDTETDRAMEELNKTSYIALDFPRRDKTFVDPSIVNQVYSLFSFVPSKEAKPDKNGVYGYGKIRGCFSTDIEANQRAEFIIRNVDSYHPIYHGFVGRPFPITASSDYSAEVNEIDIKKQMTDSISADVKAKKLEEKKEIEHIGTIENQDERVTKLLFFVKHKLKHRYAQKLGYKSLRPALCRAKQKKMNSTNTHGKNAQQHIAVLHDKLGRSLLVKNRLPRSAGKCNG